MITRCTHCGHVLAAGVEPLTSRQAAVLDVITTSIDATGAAATYNEMAAALGLRSLASVAELVEKLERKGYIRRTRSRTDGGRISQGIAVLVRRTELVPRG